MDKLDYFTVELNEVPYEFPNPTSVSDVLRSYLNSIDVFSVNGDFFLLRFKYPNAAFTRVYRINVDRTALFPVFSFSDIDYDVEY